MLTLTTIRGGKAAASTADNANKWSLVFVLLSFILYSFNEDEELLNNCLLRWAVDDTSGASRLIGRERERKRERTWCTTHIPGFTLNLSLIFCISSGHHREHHIPNVQFANWSKAEKGRYIPFPFFFFWIDTSDQMSLKEICSSALFATTTLWDADSRFEVEMLAPAAAAAKR